MTNLTYQEACALYLDSAEGLPYPSEGLSEEIDGKWFLENVNGMLAVVSPEGEIMRPAKGVNNE